MRTDATEHCNMATIPLHIIVQVSTSFHYTHYVLTLNILNKYYNKTKYIIATYSKTYLNQPSDIQH